MVKNINNELHHIKVKAINHSKTPDDLIRAVTKVCRLLFNINEFYSEVGIITKRDAQDLLSNNIIAAKRQHDLADAEYFWEQKSQLSNLYDYFTETIHGCHIAPTVTPITGRDVINIIKKIHKRMIDHQ